MTFGQRYMVLSGVYCPISSGIGWQWLCASINRRGYRMTYRFSCEQVRDATELMECLATTHIRSRAG